MQPPTFLEPSINETAFSCPHCGAYTTQFWYALRSEQIKDGGTPRVASRIDRNRIERDRSIPDNTKKALFEWLTKLETGLVFLEDREGEFMRQIVNNLHMSKCFNCSKIAVWIAERLAFPAKRADIRPNSDLPDDIVRDFDEARDIVDASPRGAAALLRLCIQKLCAHLGEKGKRIDDDIGSLVKKGLNPVVQQSLDIVRVIGNEAVHPGVIDLRDDRCSALRLFELLNAIAEQMISHPKKVAEMYAKLPEDKRMAIERRDGTIQNHDVSGS